MATLSSIFDIGASAINMGGGMASYDTGVTNGEIGRIHIQSGETLVVERLDVRQKGGGSSNNFSANVYDETNATEVVSQDLGGLTKDKGEITGPADVLLRYSNSTGSPVEAEINLQVRIINR